MKVSASTLCRFLAAAYLAAHLPFLAPSLEDIDSINFALGLREFDVSAHQPHPPGSPVYIALGRLSLAVIDVLAPSLSDARAEALALAIWSALAGALALAAAYAVFAELKQDTLADPVTPLWAATVLAAAPLFWMSGLRPMSDLPGLAAGLTAQALILRGRRDHRAFLLGALAAGLAIGVRVQTLWLTAPLLLIVAAGFRGAGAVARIARAGAAAAAGSLAWAIPLVIVSGGPAAYVASLGSQAGEDFAWVDMLLLNPTPRHAAFALYETFVLPWGSIPLAVAAGVAAVAGAVVVALRAPASLGLAAVAFGPYVAFHLLFQETPVVRYALPALPAVAWLIGHGVSAAGRFAPAVGIPLVLAALVTSVPGAMAYAREPHPAFRAIADLSAAATTERPAALFSHFAIRRPLQASPPSGVRVVDPPRASEWAGVVEYWRGGGTDPVWFLADPRRTDLAVIDPRARDDVRRYRWAAADRRELQGVRPAGVDWYRLQHPGWFTGEGWSLTPELGGITRLAGTGPDRQPVHAYVRRRAEPMVGIVGARHLGTIADGRVMLSFEIDGRLFDFWDLDPEKGPNVLKVLHLPAVALRGAGPYARVTIQAHPATEGAATPPVAIRQFDVQPATGMVVGFDEGWHEEEYENATGLRWRWSSGRAVLRIVPPRGIRLRLSGESPLRYQGVPPTVRITAAGRVIAERHPDGDFTWTIDVPEEAVRAAEGRVAIETAPVYLPGRAEGTSDARELGLRLFEIDVDPASP